MALFENNKININGVELNKLTLNDKRLFDEYAMNNDYTRVGYEHGFAYLYTTNVNENDNSNIAWKEIDDYLCVFTYNNRSNILRLCASPLNKNNDYSEIKNIYKKCLVILSKANDESVSRCEYINSLDKDIFDKDNCSITPQLDCFVFRSDDLIELKGKKYSSRRAIVNKFKKENPNHTFRSYNKSDYNDVVRVYEGWVKEFKERTEYGIVAPYLIKSVLDNVDDCEFRINVCEVNNKIEGFIVIYQICKNTMCVMLEHTNVNIKGMTEMLWYEGLRMNRDLGEFEIDGNGGTKTNGLYFYKTSHRPCYMIESLDVKFNKKGNKIKKNVFSKDVE